MFSYSNMHPALLVDCLFTVYKALFIMKLSDQSEAIGTHEGVAAVTAAETSAALRTAATSAAVAYSSCE